MTAPYLTAILDQVQASDHDLYEFLRRAAPDVNVSTFHDTGPVAAATVDRMLEGSTRDFKACFHIIAQPDTWTWWYAHQPGDWKCGPCHGTVEPPEVCDGCGGEFDTRHAHVVYISAHRRARSVTPPIALIMSLCSRCTADNADELSHRDRS